MYDKLKNYQPKNEQEQIDKQAMLSFIEKNEDVLERSNLIAHLTSSAFVVNETMDKVLFAHHNIYNSWGWVGGHNDGDPDCLRVALKEAKEETGVQNIYPYYGEILGIDIIHVNPHFKNGSHVSDHLHLNVTYLFIADEQDELIVAKEENSNVHWFSMDEVLEHVSEPRMIPVYEKLFQRVHEIKQGERK